MSAESEFDWITLEPDEEVLWSGQPHIYQLLPAVALSLVLIGLPFLLAGYLNRENTDYVVTSSGLYKKTGILSRDVQKIEFGNVQDISFSQGVIGKSVGYGNVNVSTAGGSGVEMQFQAVPDPKEVQEMINREIRRSRQSEEEKRGKADVLDEILGELREIRRAVEGGATAGTTAEASAGVDAGGSTAGDGEGSTAGDHGGSATDPDRTPVEGEDPDRTLLEDEDPDRTLIEGEDPDGAGSGDGEVDWAPMEEEDDDRRAE